MLTHILATLALAVVCQAQVPHLGPCPNVTVVQNLDVNKYMGDWYEIEKFVFLIEGTDTCIRANYSLLEDGYINVINRAITINGTEVNITGDAHSPDSNVAAKLVVEFNNSSPPVPYWILDTDYDNYSLVWSCLNFLGITHAEYAWILSRTKRLDPATVTTLKNKLASFGVGVRSFKPTVQDNCPY